MEKQNNFENILRCKWSIAVLQQIEEGTKQPGMLLRRIPGLSKKILYQRLKKFQRFEYIYRRLITQKPLKVFYGLTPRGRKAIKIIRMIRSL